MGDYLALLSTAAVVWMAFSFFKLLQTFTAFREDYRRVHKLGTEDLSNSL
jgi:hypothetical protein